jgi:DNA-nicking Smr family endonuclease
MGKASGKREKRPAVSPEEREAFLAAVGGVRPLDARDRLPVAPPPPSPIRPEVLPPEIKLTVEGDGRRYAARAPGVSHSQVADLRTGKLHLEATLDLHGSTIDRARSELRRFLLESRRLGRKRLLVIHGKGLHSEAGAPLREAVLAELLGPLSGFIHALATAANADGGEGATYVMLRGSK